jgi:hypothetical protein
MMSVKEKKRHRQGCGPFAYDLASGRDTAVQGDLQVKRAQHGADTAFLSVPIRAIPRQLGKRRTPATMRQPEYIILDICRVITDEEATSSDLMVESNGTERERFFGRLSVSVRAREHQGSGRCPAGRSIVRL